LEAELAEVNWRIRWDDIMFGAQEKRKLERSGSRLSLARVSLHIMLFRLLTCFFLHGFVLPYAYTHVVCLYTVFQNYMILLCHTHVVLVFC